MPTLSNLKLIACGFAVLVVFGSGWWVRGIIARQEIALALESQQKTLIAKCEADKEITRKASEEYEIKISNLSSRVANLKRVQSTKCVPITNPASTINDPATSGLSKSYGVTASELIDYGSDAEKTRQQLISLQDFVRNVWGVTK